MTGFSGLAFGPDGRLYSGVQLNDTTDQQADADHASPMGISPIGQTLYVALFGGLVPGNPVVVSMNTNGKQVKPFLSGYAAPVLAVGTRKGNVYTGDLTGAIYRVAAG